jgi:hypothetical protein
MLGVPHMPPATTLRLRTELVADKDIIEVVVDNENVLMTLLNFSVLVCQYNHLQFSEAHANGALLISLALLYRESRWTPFAASHALFDPLNDGSFSASLYEPSHVDPFQFTEEGDLHLHLDLELDLVTGLMETLNRL